MGRNPSDSESTRWASLILLLTGLISCTVVYMFASMALRPTKVSSNLESLAFVGGDLEGESGECCRGIEILELWGAAVKWGYEFKFNSSKECCKACKAMCTGNHGPCLCDSWVFCGNREACGKQFSEVSYNLTIAFIDFLMIWLNLIIWCAIEVILFELAFYSELFVMVNWYNLAVH